MRLNAQRRDYNIIHVGMHVCMYMCISMHVLYSVCDLHVYTYTALHLYIEGSPSQLQMCNYSELELNTLLVQCADGK